MCILNSTWDTICIYWPFTRIVVYLMREEQITILSSSWCHTVILILWEGFLFIFFFKQYFTHAQINSSTCITVRIWIIYGHPFGRASKSLAECCLIKIKIKIVGHSIGLLLCTWQNHFLILLKPPNIFLLLQWIHVMLLLLTFDY